MSLPMVTVDGREYLPCKFRLEWGKPSCPIKRQWCSLLRQIVTVELCQTCAKREVL